MSSSWLRPASGSRRVCSQGSVSAVWDLCPYSPAQNVQLGWFSAGPSQLHLGLFLLWMSSFTCSLWAGAEGKHSWTLVVGLGFGTTVACVQPSLPHVACQQLLVSVLTAFSLYPCYRVYQGPKVNEERRWVMAIIWRLGLPSGTCHGSQSHVLLPGRATVPCHHLPAGEPGLRVGHTE